MSFAGLFSGLTALALLSGSPFANAGPQYLDVNVSIKNALQGRGVEVSLQGQGKPLVKVLGRALFARNR